MFSDRGSQVHHRRRRAAGVPTQGRRPLWLSTGSSL